MLAMVQVVAEIVFEHYRRQAGKMGSSLECTYLFTTGLLIDLEFFPHADGTRNAFATISEPEVYFVRRLWISSPEAAAIRAEAGVF